MPSSRTPLQYRPEVDGLRAVAVLGVIAFHAGVAATAGGFVGVDVFYVISGYLITKIVVDALGEKRFSFLEFYARRIKRLLPAASVLLISTVVFGAVVLTPYEYRELAKSAMFSGVFLANVWFSRNSGYFDQASDVSPLVHMWSLAVEEQFYLVFPALVLMAHRLGGRRGVFLAIGLVTAVSFGLSVAWSAEHPDSSFYLLPTRAWELGLGGLLNARPVLDSRHARRGSLLSALGMLLIVVGMFGFSHDVVYPGWLALVPVAGSALVLYATTAESNPLRRALAADPVVLVGRFSYSAYLWHWPVIVFYRIYIGGRAFDAIETTMLIGLSLVLGYVSWRSIEERFRHSDASLFRVYAGFIVATGLVIALPFFVYLSRGFPERIPPELREIADARVMWKWDCVDLIRPFDELDESFCVVGEPWEEAKLRGIVWGDSHSQHWAPMLDLEARRHGLSLVIAPRQCPPYLNEAYVRSHYIGAPRFTEDCTLRNELAIDMVNRDPRIELIVMAAAWSGHVRMLYDDDHRTNRSSRPIAERSSAVGASLSRLAFESVLSRLDLDGRRILLLGDIARPNRNLTECAIIEQVDLLRKPCGFSHRELDAPSVRAWHADSDQVLLDIAGDHAEIELILPIPKQCDADTCPTYLNGELLYRDSNHFRRNLKPETAALISEQFGLRDYFAGLELR